MRHNTLRRFSFVTALAALFVLPIAATTSIAGHASGSASFAPNTQWSLAARNARLSGLATASATGFLDYYSGTQPANGDATVTGTLLCSAPLGSTAFKAPSAGAMSNNGIVTCTGTAGATGTGTAAGYVVEYKSDHTTVLGMFSVGTSSANIILPSTTITTGEVVSIADGAFTVTDNGNISGQ